MSAFESAVSRPLPGAPPPKTRCAGPPARSPPDAQPGVGLVWRAGSAGVAADAGARRERARADAVGDLARRRAFVCWSRRRRRRVPLAAGGGRRRCSPQLHTEAGRRRPRRGAHRAVVIRGERVGVLASLLRGSMAAGAGRARAAGVQERGEVLFGRARVSRLSSLHRFAALPLLANFPHERRVPAGPPGPARRGGAGPAAADPAHAGPGPAGDGGRHDAPGADAHGR